MSLLDAIKQPLEEGAPDGVPTPEDMDVINGFASAPLSPDSVFVYPCIMANRAMSGYGLNMGDSSLINFARAAEDGTPLHIMHDRQFRNVGYTYAGHFDDGSGEARAAVYIVRGRAIKDGAGFGGQRDQNTSQEIADIQAGLRRCVSVGIGGAFVSYVCNICGQDVFSSWYEEDGCPHIPGMKYEGVFATARLDNGTLVELSNVDSGAIPGAEIGRPYNGGRRIEAAPYETSQEFVPPVGTVGYAAPAFGSPFVPKLVHQFRRGTVGRADLSDWLNLRGLTDETRKIFAQPGATPPGGKPAGTKGNSMNWKKLLQAAGFAAAAALLPDGDITAEQVVAHFGSMIREEAAKHVSAHPIISTLAAAGIETPAQFLEMARLAEDGRAFVESANETLRAACVRMCATPAEATAQFDAISTLPARRQMELAAQFNKTTDKLYGIGVAADGSAVAASARPAAPLNNPAFAGEVVTSTPGWDDPAIKAEAKEVAARTRSRRNASAAPARA